MNERPPKRFSHQPPPQMSANANMQPPPIPRDFDAKVYYSGAFKTGDRTRYSMSHLLAIAHSTLVSNDVVVPLADTWKRTSRNNFIHTAAHRQNRRTNTNTNTSRRSNARRQPDQSQQAVEWDDAPPTATAQNVDAMFSRDAFDMEKFKQEMRKRDQPTSASAAQDLFSHGTPSAAFDMEKFKADMHQRDSVQSSTDSIDTAAAIMGSHSAIDQLALDDHTAQPATRSGGQSRFGGRFFTLDADVEDQQQQPPPIASHPPSQSSSQMTSPNALVSPPASSTGDTSSRRSSNLMRPNLPTSVLRKMSASALTSANNPSPPQQQQQQHTSPIKPHPTMSPSLAPKLDETRKIKSESVLPNTQHQQRQRMPPMTRDDMDLQQQPPQPVPLFNGSPALPPPFLHPQNHVSPDAAAIPPFPFPPPFPGDPMLPPPPAFLAAMLAANGQPIPQELVPFLPRDEQGNVVIPPLPPLPAGALPPPHRVPPPHAMPPQKARPIAATGPAQPMPPHQNNKHSKTKPQKGMSYASIASHNAPHDTSINGPAQQHQQHHQPSGEGDLSKWFGHMGIANASVGSGSAPTPHQHPGSTGRVLTLEEIERGMHS